MTYLVIGVASLILTLAGLLVNKIWRDSERMNEHMRESLLQVNTQTNESNAKLNEQIGKLAAAVSGLNATVLAQGEDVHGFKQNCSEHRKTVSDRLKEHGIQLDRHETEIQVLKVKVDGKSK